MIDFTFQNPAKIIFGKTALSHLGEEVTACGSRVLLVYGGGSVKRIGLYDAVMAILRDVGASVWELSGIQPNPRLAPVREGVELCRKNDVQLVLAIGGGSAIDTAKAIAVGTPYNGDVWDLFGGEAQCKAALPVGVVLTLPATGSEMSDSAVITREDDQCKRSLNTFFNIPRFSILNPEYTYSLPPYQTACGAVDIMAHIMERYFTRTEHVELIDRMAEGALVTVVNNAPIVMREPDNYDARAEIMWAGCLAHNNLLGTGRVGDWASHKLEHELSALYDVAHGAGLAIIFPAWMKYMIAHGGEKKLAQFATRVMSVPESFGDEIAVATEGVKRLEAFYRSLDLVTTLHEANIGADDFDRMATRCTQMGGGTVGQYIKLDKAAALEIYELAK